MSQGTGLFHIGGFSVRDLATAVISDCLPVASLEV